MPISDFMQCGVDSFDALLHIQRKLARMPEYVSRAFDEKAESIVDSHDGTNQIQHPHWYKGPVMNGEALFR
jgi:hypothetical protein